MSIFATKVTVVILAYQHEKFIQRCISSVLAQRIDGLEVIVLDDCSSDKTVELARQYEQDERLTVIVNEHNLGMVDNSTKAYQLGEGQYTTVLPGDDYYMPGHLQDLVKVLDDNPQCALAYCPCYWVDDEDRIIKIATHPGHKPQDYAGGRNELADLLMLDNYITPTSVLMRRDIAQQAGFVDINVAGAGDWDTYIRIAQINPDFAYVSRASVAYRIHSAQYTKKFNQSMEPLECHVGIIEKVLVNPQSHASLKGYTDAIADYLDRRALYFVPFSDSPIQQRIAAIKQQLQDIEQDDEVLDLQPLVSIIVPTYNRPDLLQDALHSILAQSYKNWEAVVVNDAGLDVSSLVREIDPSAKIRYVSHAKNGGLSAARNTGIVMTRGDIICYLDDDDRFKPDHLQTIVDGFNTNPNAGVVYTEAEYIAETSVDGKRHDGGRSTPLSNIDFSLERLHITNFIPVNCWTHKRSLLNKIDGLFDTELSALEDWDMLIRLGRETEFVHIAELTAEVWMRVDSSVDNMTSREGKGFPELFQKIYERYPYDSETIEVQRRLAIEEQEARSRIRERGYDPDKSYQQWLSRHALKESDAQYFAERMVTQWRNKDAIHIIMTHVSGQEDALADTIDSLAQQLYQEWGLSIVSQSKAPDDFGGAENIEWLQLDCELMSGVNELIKVSPAEWIMVLRAGDLLQPETLFTLVDHINRYPEWRLVYFDEDRKNTQGERYDPLFKPEINIELLRSTPYIGQVVVFRKDEILAGGVLNCAETGISYEVSLRLLDACGAAAIGHISQVLLTQQDQYQLAKDQQQVVDDRRLVLTEHIQRNDLNAEVRDGLVFGSFFVDYAVDDSALVSVIIPSKNHLELIKPCIDGLLQKTAWDKLEIILIDNASDEQNVQDYYESLQQQQHVRVLNYPLPFNYAAMNNLGAAAANGDYLLFLNNDIQVLQADWLSRMVALAQQQSIGVVGARLLYFDISIQHAGLVLGLGGTAGFVFSGTALTDTGYMGRIQLTQEYSAVSGSCMMLANSLFDQLQGFDEDRFPIFYGDIDLCLRAKQVGYSTVWTPQSTLMHLGAASIRALDNPSDLDKDWQQRDNFIGKWRKQLANDPAYNHNLSLLERDARVEVEVDVPWDTQVAERPRLLGFPLNDGALGELRAKEPLNALDSATLAQHSLMPSLEGKKTKRVLSIAELERAQPDTLFALHAIDELFMDWMKRYRNQTDTFLVQSLDDNLFDIPERNSSKSRLPSNMHERVEATLSHCHRLIVTTEPLVEVYKDYIDDIRVVPNSLDANKWAGLKSLRRQGEKMRVGWAGAQQHQGDLEWLAPVIEALADEVEWVFMGMCPNALKPFVKEFHPPVYYHKYADYLAGLNLDLAIAPLEVNGFNECKSDLRLLEYGVLGWPVVCTDIYPYKNNRVNAIPNKTDVWIDTIRQLINDPKELALQGNRLQDWVMDKRLLQKNTDVWMKALFSDEVLASR